jgi:thiamine biosynthesis lipoprotein
MTTCPTRPKMQSTSTTFRSMGTSVHIVICSDSSAELVELHELARQSIEQLERCWSRFLSDSDIGRINHSPDVPVRVEAETIELVSRAIDGWAQTDGFFDPTVGGSLRAAGYDRPFTDLPPIAPGGTTPAPSPKGIVVHPTASTVTVPVGVELDLGGIGKGAAADVTAQRLLDAGAGGVMVNLGGDLRADGAGPIDGWRVRLDCPGAEGQREIRIASGAVCTSSTLERRWTTRASERHHIIEPSTGRSTTTDLCTATVVGAEATQCEVLATTALGLGLVGARRLIETHGACGLLIDLTGTVHEAGPIGDFT